MRSTIIIISIECQPQILASLKKKTKIITIVAIATIIIIIIECQPQISAPLKRTKNNYDEAPNTIINISLMLLFNHNHH